MRNVDLNLCISRPIGDIRKITDHTEKVISKLSAAAESSSDEPFTPGVLSESTTASSVSELLGHEASEFDIAAEKIPPRLRAYWPDYWTFYFDSPFLPDEPGARWVSSGPDANGKSSFGFVSTLPRTARFLHGEIGIIDSRAMTVLLEQSDVIVDMVLHLPLSKDLPLPIGVSQKGLALLVDLAVRRPGPRNNQYPASDEVGSPLPVWLETINPKDLRALARTALKLDMEGVLEDIQTAWQDDLNRIRMLWYAAAPGYNIFNKHDIMELFVMVLWVIVSQCIFGLSGGCHGTTWI